MRGQKSPKLPTKMTLTNDTSDLPLLQYVRHEWKNFEFVEKLLCIWLPIFGIITIVDVIVFLWFINKE